MPVVSMMMTIDSHHRIAIVIVRAIEERIIEEWIIPSGIIATERVSEVIEIPGQAVVEWRIPS